MKKIATLLACLILILAFVSCGKEQTIDIQENQIKKICNLTTISMQIHTIAEGDNTSGWWIFSKTYKYYYQFDAKVELGVDLEGIEVDKLTKTVNVNLSEVNIKQISIINDTRADYEFIMYDDDNILRGNQKLTLNEKAEEDNRAISVLKEDITKQKTMFAIAEDRAKELIQNYVNIVSNGEYRAVFNTNKTTD